MYGLGLRLGYDEVFEDHEDNNKRGNNSNN